MKTRRICANLPGDLLEEAIRVTGAGITGTLVEGLRLVARRRAYEKLLRLKGRLDLDLDLDKLRGRAGR